MFAALAAALLTQQVITQTPCYAALAGLCSDPPKHTHDCHSCPVSYRTERCQSNQRRLQVLPTLAFVLITGFTANNGAIATIVVPGLPTRTSVTSSPSR